MKLKRTWYDHKFVHQPDAGKIAKALRYEAVIAGKDHAINIIPHDPKNEAEIAEMDQQAVAACRSTMRHKGLKDWKTCEISIDVQ